MDVFGVWLLVAVVRAREYEDGKEFLSNESFIGAIEKGVGG